MRRVLLIVLLVVVIGAVAVWILTQQTPTPDPNATGQPEVTREVTQFPTETPIPVAEVVIAVQDIPRGVEVQPNMVEMVSFPLEYLPQGTFDDLNSVIGRIARTDISRSQLVLSRQIIAGPFTQAAADLGRVGSDAAAVLEAGRVAISLPIDAITSVAYAVQPGDSVDVLVSMLFVDVDIPFQTITPNIIRFVTLVPDPETGSLVLGFGPEGEGTLDTERIVSSSAGSVAVGGETQAVGQDITLTNSVIVEPSEEDGQRPRLVTQRTVKDARVIWVGEFPLDGQIFRAAPAPTPTPLPDAEPTEDTGDGGPTPLPTVPPRPEIITLGVTPQDAVVLTYMAEAGLPMTFALRSARAVGLPETQAVTLSYIMNTYGIQLPDRFNFALEPAIRSIRQLSLGNRISLTSDAAEAPAAASGN